MSSDSIPSDTELPDQLEGAESSFEWLVRAMGGVEDGPSQPMLARPNAGAPELLLPLRTRAATEAALRRSHDDRRARQRALTTFGRTAGRVGLLPRITGERLDFPMTRVLRDLQKLVGDPKLQISIGAGPPRRNRKPVVMLIRDSGEIAAFAKVGWSPFTMELTRNEFKILALIDGKLPTPILTPAPLELIERPDLLIAVTSAMQSHDWARPKPLLPEQIDAIGQTVGHRTTTVSDLAWLTSPNFGARTDELETTLETTVAEVPVIYGSTKVEVGLWHGDLNPWNLISSSKGVGVIDWEFAGLDRPIGQDRRHLRFEAVRRDPSVSAETAVTSFVEQELQGQSTKAELAIYLADIAIRESQLSGQGWSGAMSGYRAPLIVALGSLLS